MYPSVKRLTVVATVLLGAGLMGRQVEAAYFGTLTLKPGETQQLYIGTTARNVRVCNDFNSSGPVVVTIANNIPHDLLPGRCAEDIGDRMTVQSHAAGQVMINYRSIYDEGGHRNLFEDD